MSWLILLLLVPAILAPFVLLCGFAGCGLDSEGSSTEVAVVQLPRPSSLAASVVGNKVLLTWQWNHAEYVVRFIVNRESDGNPPEPIKKDLGGTSYEDKDVEAGTTYTYTVQAWAVGYKTSKRSDKATATLPK